MRHPFTDRDVTGTDVLCWIGYAELAAIACYGAWRLAMWIVDQFGGD